MYKTIKTCKCWSTNIKNDKKQIDVWDKLWTFANLYYDYCDDCWTIYDFSLEN